MTTSSIMAHPSTATALPAPGVKTISLLDLIPAIQKYGPAQAVQAHMQDLTKAEKAQTVVDLLNLHDQAAEAIGVMVTYIWEMFVVPEHLMDHYEGGATKFLQDVYYNEFVLPTIEASKATDRCKANHRASIEVAWQQGWESKIDEHGDHPSYLSEKYLQKMAKLAGNGMILSDATVLLRKVMDARVSKRSRGIRRRRAIMVSDIEKVIAAVTSVSQHCNLQPRECSLRQLTDFLDHGIPAVPETPQIPQNSNSASVLLLPSGAQPLTVEVFYNVNYPQNQNMLTTLNRLLLVLPHRVLAKMRL